LDLPIEFIEVSEDDITRAIPITHNLLREAGIFSDFEKLNLIHLSIGVGMVLACQAAQQRGVGLLLSAQGADALFAGFDRYQRVPPEDLEATLKEDVEETVSTGLVRDRAIADQFSARIVAPFLDPTIIELATRIPTAFKLGPQGDKLVLRELARQRGLPEFIALRPKKSIQYSTGIWRMMKQILAR
jgi:asparagine synthase (glutamine-hydrolysing)